MLIVVPPDIRWMDQEGDGFETWYYESDKARYRSRVGDKTKDRFRYHASVITYSIQSVLDSIGCKYLFMHNYGGEFIIDRRFKSLINVIIRPLKINTIVLDESSTLMDSIYVMLLALSQSGGKGIEFLLAYLLHVLIFVFQLSCSSIG